MQPFTSSGTRSPLEQESEQPLDVMGAIKFIFMMERPWTTILLAVVTLFIPVVGGLAMFGWHCEIMQRLQRKHPQPIPEYSFSDLMVYVTRGVVPFAVQLVVSLPAALLVVGLVLVGFVTAAVAGGASRSAGDPNFALIAVVCVVAVAAGSAVLALTAVCSHAAVTRAELTEDFGAALAIRPLMAYLKSMWLSTLGALLLFSVVTGVGSLAGLLCCYVGVFPVAIIMGVATVHLRHQLYCKYLARGGEAIDVKAAAPLPSEVAAQASQYPFQR